MLLETELAKHLQPRQLNKMNETENQEKHCGEPSPPRSRNRREDRRMNSLRNRGEIYEKVSQGLKCITEM